MRNTSNVVDLDSRRKLKAQGIDPKASLQLILHIIYQACIDGDVAWFESKHCEWYLSVIPDELLSTMSVSEKTPREIADQLIYNIKSGMYKQKSIL